MDIVIGDTYTNKNGEKFKVVQYSDRRSKAGNRFVVISFIAIDPNGIEHHVTGIKKFCREHNLVYPRVSECLNQTRTQHKGWKFHY